MVPIVCRASIGVVGNGDHNLINIGKAGRKRHMGIRPTVRGSVMNPMTIHMVVVKVRPVSDVRVHVLHGVNLHWVEDQKEKQTVQQVHRKKKRWKSISKIIRRLEHGSFIEKRTFRRR